jgi:hypothetical protein
VERSIREIFLNDWKERERISSDREGGIRT